MFSTLVPLLFVSTKIHPPYQRLRWMPLIVLIPPPPPSPSYFGGQGLVISAGKMTNTIVIRRDYLHFVSKYRR